MPLITILVFRFFRYLYDLKISKESDKKMEVNRNNEITLLLENRKKRTNNKVFDENEFWEIVTEIRKKSKDSYITFIGLFKDRLLKINSEKLIEIDNLIISFYQKYLTKEIAGASQVIFENSDINYTFLLMNYLISKNQVVFKNTCLKIELIEKLKIEDLTLTTINDLIADCYYLSTKELIPEYNIEEISIKYSENLYKREELPEIFPNLWKQYG